jgi:hypothetical protein
LRSSTDKYRHPGDQKRSREQFPSVVNYSTSNNIPALRQIHDHSARGKIPIPYRSHIGHIPDGSLIIFWKSQPGQASGQRSARWGSREVLVLYFSFNTVCVLALCISRPPSIQFAYSHYVSHAHCGRSINHFSSKCAGLSIKVSPSHPYNAGRAGHGWVGGCEGMCGHVIIYRAQKAIQGDD